MWKIASRGSIRFKSMTFPRSSYQTYNQSRDINTLLFKQSLELTYFKTCTDGQISFLNATEDETIEFGTPKVGIKNYPVNYAEQWILIVPEGRQVQIDFDIFELEESENCKFDYIEIREVDPKTDEGQTGPILTGRLCGSTMPSAIQSAGNMVWVQFASNNNATTVYKGFRASFKAGWYKLETSLN